MKLVKHLQYTEPRQARAMLVRSRVFELLETRPELANVSDAQLTVRVERYSNGREQGYALVVETPVEILKFVFSENRSSDDLVLYWGPSNEFEDETNIPSENQYEHREYVPYSTNAENEMADLIVESLIDWMRDNKIFEMKVEG